MQDKTINGYTFDTEIKYQTELIYPFTNTKNSYNIYTMLTLDDAKESMRDHLLNDCDLSYRHCLCTLDGYDPVDNPESFAKVKEFAKYPRQNDCFMSMILYSVPPIYGVGKTHLVNALTHYWYDDPNLDVRKAHCNMGEGIIDPDRDELIVRYAGIRYQIIREVDLMDKIKDTFSRDSKETEMDIYRKLAKYDILAIDDIGKYTPANLDFYQRIMFHIIDDRYNSGKGLILSTNKPPNELEHFIGSACADRLNEMCSDYILEFKGDSHRGRKDNTNRKQQNEVVKNEN